MSLTALQTVSCSTKRQAPYSNGKMSTPSTYLTELKCIAVMPLISGNFNAKVESANVAMSGRVEDYWISAVTKQAHKKSNAAVNELPDIIPGDNFVIGSKQYKVKETHDWPATFSTNAFLYLILEESQK